MLMLTVAIERGKFIVSMKQNNDDGDNDQTDCDDADGGGGNSKDNGDEDGALIGKVVMRLMMVMSKLSILQVALLNAVEVPKWK